MGSVNEDDIEALREENSRLRSPLENPAGNDASATLLRLTEEPGSIKTELSAQKEFEKKLLARANKIEQDYAGLRYHAFVLDQDNKNLKLKLTGAEAEPRAFRRHY